MLNVTIVVLMMLACVLLIAVIISLGLSLRGGMSVIFPGLGIVVAMPVLFVVLLMAEVCVVVLAAYLVKSVSFLDIMSRMSGTN